LLNYLKLYNYHTPQRAIDSKTPSLALKEWQKKRPELFVKRVYEQVGLAAKLYARSLRCRIGRYFASSTFTFCRQM